MKEWLSRAKTTLETQTWYKISAQTLDRFADIDGEMRASAFAYYAFFSLFPLVILFVTIAANFVEQEQATQTILSYIGQHLPLTGEKQGEITVVLARVVESRGQAGLVASVVLLWGAMRFFSVLIRAINCAWDTEPHTWWRLPLKNLLMLAIVASAVVLGIVAPVVLQVISNRIHINSAVVSWFFDVALFLIPFLVLFYAFSMLYKLAPRKPRTFAQVWTAALIVTLLLRSAQYLFILYLENFSNFNALYGTLGGIMALLMWIYLSGYIIILGGCLSVVLFKRAESRPASV